MGIMSEKTLGIAIHKAGGVARAHTASRVKTPHARIVSVSSRSRESAERLAADELCLAIDWSVAEGGQAIRLPLD
jgi:hypothetical protein